jgi:hypothetical protein
LEHDELNLNGEMRESNNAPEKHDTLSFIKAECAV